MSMNLWAKRLWEIAIILSILSPSSRVFALSETQSRGDDAYDRTQHEFVLSSREEVTVFCEAGDSMVKGSCEARTDSASPYPERYLNDMPPRTGVRDDGYGYVNAEMFETREIHEQGRAGFACRVKLVRPEQELRVTAALKCRKATEKAQKTKTPRFRGV